MTVQRTPDGRAGMTDELSAFESDPPHGVWAITLSPSRLSLSVGPWDEAEPRTEVSFSRARLSSVETRLAEPDELDLPWQIIGFDRQPVSPGRWRFTLSCLGIEYVFEADRPKVVTAG